MLDPNIVEDIKKTLKKGERIGRRTVQKKYGVSEAEARVYLATAKYLLDREEEQKKDIVKKQMSSLKKREEKERLQEEFFLSVLEKAVQKFPVPKQIKEPPTRVRRGGEEVAVILCSDWHIGEVVRSEQVSGVNEFNENIASARLELFAEKIAELLDLQRHYTTINRAVVWLGGDMVSGIIHQELSDTATLLAVEQTALAGYLMAQFIAEVSTLFREVTVITTVGNHGRMTKKRAFKTHTINNLDYVAYQICAFALKNYKHVKFHVDASIFRYTDIFGWRFVFSHGDETRSWMGIPFYGLRRDFSAKQAINVYVHSNGDFTKAVQPVNYKVVGHFHTTGVIPENLGFIIMNGSLKGVDEFSFTKGFISRPSQFFFGVHKAHGLTFNYPVWLDGSKREPSRYTIEVPDVWADMEV